MTGNPIPSAGTARDVAECAYASCTAFAGRARERPIDVNGGRFHRVARNRHLLDELRVPVQGYCAQESIGALRRSACSCLIAPTSRSTNFAPPVGDAEGAVHRPAEAGAPRANAPHGHTNTCGRSMDRDALASVTPTVRGSSRSVFRTVFMANAAGGRLPSAEARSSSAPGGILSGVHTRAGFIPDFDRCPPAWAHHAQFRDVTLESTGESGVLLGDRLHFGLDFLHEVEAAAALPPSSSAVRWPLPRGLRSSAAPECGC